MQARQSVEPRKEEGKRRMSLENAASSSVARTEGTWEKVAGTWPPY